MLRHKEAMFGMLSSRLDYDPQRFAAGMAQLQRRTGAGELRGAVHLWRRLPGLMPGIGISCSKGPTG